jgi:hypothetical protein
MKKRADDRDPQGAPRTTHFYTAQSDQLELTSLTPDFPRRS